jgi:hypothetical protein
MSDAQQQATRILDHVLDPREEGYRLTAINDPMVIG